MGCAWCRRRGQPHRGPCRWRVRVPRGPPVLCWPTRRPWLARASRHLSTDVRCSGPCKRELPAGEFHRASTPRGRQLKCKDCAAAMRLKTRTTKTRRRCCHGLLGVRCMRWATYRCPTGGAWRACEDHQLQGDVQIAAWRETVNWLYAVDVPHDLTAPQSSDAKPPLRTQPAPRSPCPSAAGRPRLHSGQRSRLLAALRRAVAPSAADAASARP